MKDYDNEGDKVFFLLRFGVNFTHENARTRPSTHSRTVHNWNTISFNFLSSFAWDK